MTRLHPPTIMVFALFVAALLNGCSFSKSSESSSGSSKSAFNLASSPVKSSSKSSQTKEEQFQDDVADYTAEFVVSAKGDLDTFRNRLSTLAKRHGITNWESDRQTFVGIGRGLRQADIGKPQISAFQESLAGDDPVKRRAIEEGLKH